MTSDTPRTDAEETVCCENEMCVPISFARKLERELATAIKQRDEARREVCYAKSCARFEIGHEVNTEEAIAAERGWDCFKEGGGA